MKIETNHLLTIRIYADAHGMSLAWAYAQVKKDKVQVVTIDNVKFIKTK